MTCFIEPKNENSRKEEEAYARNIRSVSRRNSCSTKTWTDHRTLHTIESDRSKTGIKNISVHSKKWNPKHEEASGSTNEEIEETVKIKVMGGGSPMLLKVATGVNKGFCETEVSQAQKMSQNKKGQYSTIGIEKRITTWVDRGSEMKIDYIWVSKSWNNSIFSCKIYDTDQITASDYKIILGKVETGMHTRKNTFARLRRKDRKTLSIDSDKATKEDWNAYKGRLKKEVAKIKDDCINIDINEIWERILNCIKRVAGETLPKKKRAPELQELQVEDKNLRMLKKDIRKIAKWCSKIKKFKFQKTEDSELDLFILEEGAKVLKKI
ncbi:18625_t:CDS:2 [Gigaspora rosea]|nr:18625_t:CDS:2 [Gigaspora rosea]